MARKTNRALVTTEEERNKILEENKELVEDFLNYLETTDHAPKSINVYKSNLNIFFVWLMKFAKNKDFVNKDLDLNDIKIQEEELTEVKWFSMDELKHMVETKELNEDQISCFIKVCNYLEKNK